MASPNLRSFEDLLLKSLFMEDLTVMGTMLVLPESDKARHLGTILDEFSILTHDIHFAVSCLQRGEMAPCEFDCYHDRFKELLEWKLAVDYDQRSVINPASKKRGRKAGALEGQGKNPSAGEGVMRD